jgi:hypothetical protein
LLLATMTRVVSVVGREWEVKKWAFQLNHENINMNIMSELPFPFSPTNILCFLVSKPRNCPINTYSLSFMQLYILLEHVAFASVTWVQQNKSQCSTLIFYFLNLFSFVLPTFFFCFFLSICIRVFQRNRNNKCLYNYKRDLFGWFTWFYVD